METTKPHYRVRFHLTGEYAGGCDVVIPGSADNRGYAIFIDGRYIDRNGTMYSTEWWILRRLYYLQIKPSRPWKHAYVRPIKQQENQ